MKIKNREQKHWLQAKALEYVIGLNSDAKAFK